MVTEAAAVFVGSAAAVALTVTVAGFGTDPGALYRPDALIVPSVEFPPTIPFTVQTTAVLVVFCTVAVNCWLRFRRTVALVGEIVMLTGGGTVTFTNTVFETSPRGS